jgi:hypothetical protein
MQNIIKLEEGGTIHFTKNTPPEYARSALVFKGATDFLKRVVYLFANFSNANEISRCFFYSGEKTIHIFCTQEQFLKILNKYFYIELMRDGSIKQLKSYKDKSVYDNESESFIYDYTFDEAELMQKSEKKSLAFWEQYVLCDSLRISNNPSIFEKFNIKKFKI